jgi:drug/metabolite transporter (DMT)-like permease
MKIKSQKDFWSGVMFTLVGGAFAWGAQAYSFGSSARPGPGYFPLGLGVLLMLLGVLILVKALTLETSDGEPVGAWHWRPVLVVLGAVVVLGGILPRAGLVVALPLLVMLSSAASDEFSWRAALLNAVVLTALSYLVFVVGLKLTIPVLPAFGQPL